MTTTHHSDPAASRDADITAGGHPIVVGVASIEHDLKAVDWAVAEAKSRSVGVHLVHCWARQRVAAWTDEFDHVVIPDLVRESEAILAKARSRAAKSGGVRITTDVVNDDPADALAKLGRRATMIMLGSRHRNGIDRAMLGSVSNALVARASCPVVVLGAPTAPPEIGARVIAGVSGTAQDAAVLEFAFDEAQRRGVGLKVICCWHLPFADMQLPPPEQANLQLAEVVAGWRERYPDVDVQSAVVRAQPANALISASLSQELLVVGRRARRVRFGHLMGSVSLAVLHHATCPVAVVPAPNGNRER